MKLQKNHTAIIVCLVVMALLLCGCGSGHSTQSRAAYTTNDSYSYSNDEMNGLMYESDSAVAKGAYSTNAPASYEETARSVSSGSEGLTSTVITDTKDTKLVYTANVQAETKEFDDDSKLLAELVSSYGGYISDSSYSDSWRYGYSSGYRRQYISIRIPTEKYTEFMNGIKNIGHVTSTSDSVEDITRNYYSTKTSLESLNAQLEFLQGMYAQAKTINDMLSIRDRIADVENDIKYLTIKLNTMDDQVSYSTIHYTMTEVVEYSATAREEEEKSFGQKFVDALKYDWSEFVSFLTGLILFLAGNLWWLILLVIVFVILVARIKAKRSKRLLSAQALSKEKQNEPSK